MRSRKALPVEIALDRESAVSLRDQLVAELVRTIDSLLLPPGTGAGARGVSGSVGVAGSDLLLARGFREIRPGSGPSVAARPSGWVGSPPPRGSAPAAAPPAAIDLRPGRPFLGGFPLAAWRSAWRHAAHRIHPGPLPDLGLPGLRKELRRYLEASRWRPLAGGRGGQGG